MILNITLSQNAFSFSEHTLYAAHHDTCFHHLHHPSLTTQTHLFKNRSLPRAFRIGDDDVEERSVDASIISESDDRSKRRSRHLEQQGTENATFHYDSKQYDIET